LKVWKKRKRKGKPIALEMVWDGVGACEIASFIL
jgi:hypothetical protein